LCELVLCQLIEKNAERTVEDRSRVPIRDRMPEQILSEPQLVACGAVHREANLVTVRAERLDDRAARCRGPGCRSRWEGMCRYRRSAVGLWAARIRGRA